jgi:hypothetical protein
MIFHIWKTKNKYCKWKPEGKRPLGRPRRRWEDNVRMDLQEVGYGCEDWIGLARIGKGGGRL